ncbi:MAG: serine/threonine-protein kinase [Planctomycetota bacterium]
MSDMPSTALSDDRRERVAALLSKASRLPRESREAFVRANADNDDLVINEVLSLLAHVDDIDDEEFLEGSIELPSIETVVDSNSPVNLPRRIGPFTVKKMLATGGMGTVYIAVQDKPQRTVALKVMKAGLTGKSALRRFEDEVRVLGRLRHPYIAQIYEAGMHESPFGTVPYFAMEYVPGAKTITQYSLTHDLPIRERLALFVKVCDAVHHGHQKGVIHRDLKPGNILVDSKGIPKVIDFGVARTTDADLVSATLQTDVGQIIGTLQYMSPEQCDADPHDLDTRSDVYALGVMLYQLLCDELPYDVSTAPVLEAMRTVKEAQPENPSSFNKFLRGDLETITLKALEKDRDRRYESSAALAKDIERYLHDEPIEARPPSFTYQLRKFAKRHKGKVTAAALLMLAVIVGGVTSALGWREASTQRVRAEAGWQEADQQRERAEEGWGLATEQQLLAEERFDQSYEFATYFMTDLDRALREMSGTLQIRDELVTRAVTFYEQFKASMDDSNLDERAQLARGYLTISQMYFAKRGPNVGQREKAAEYLASAHELFVANTDIQPDHVDSLSGLAASRILRADSFERDAKRARSRSRELAKSGDSDQANIFQDRATIEFERALNELRQAEAELQHCRNAEPKNDRFERLELVVWLNVADVLADLEMNIEAAEYRTRASDARKMRFELDRGDPERKVDFALGLTRIASAHKANGELPSAISVYERVLELRESIVEQKPYSARERRRVMLTHQYLFQAYRDFGDTEKATFHIEEAEAIAERLAFFDSIDRRGLEDHVKVAERLGNWYVDQDYPFKAIDVYDRALVGLKKLEKMEPEYRVVVMRVEESRAKASTP